MDIKVRPIGSDTWEILDLLGRRRGTVHQVGGGFLIIPSGDLLNDVERGPHLSLALAFEAIERKARGVCRLVPDRV